MGKQRGEKEGATFYLLSILSIYIVRILYKVFTSVEEYVILSVINCFCCITGWKHTISLCSKKKTTGNGKIFNNEKCRYTCS